MSALFVLTTPPPTPIGDGSSNDALFWVLGGIVVVVLFGGMVWRVLQRNRLRK